MDITVINTLIGILKENETLYNAVKEMFDNETLNEKVTDSLAEKAAEKGITLDKEELADQFDEIINEGINGISIKTLGGLDGIMEMAKNFLG